MVSTDADTANLKDKLGREVVETIVVKGLKMMKLKSLELPKPRNV